MHDSEINFPSAHQNNEKVFLFLSYYTANSQAEEFILRKIEGGGEK